MASKTALKLARASFSSKATAAAAARATPFQLLKALRNSDVTVTLVEDLPRGKAELRLNPMDMKEKGIKLEDLNNEKILAELSKVAIYAATGEVAANTASVAHSVVTSGPLATVRKMFNNLKMKDDTMEVKVGLILHHVTEILNDVRRRNGMPPVSPNVSNGDNNGGSNGGNNGQGSGGDDDDGPSAGIGGQMSSLFSNFDDAVK